MAGSWIDIAVGGETRRQVLKEGLTRLGAGKAPAEIDVSLPVDRGEELHIWNRPPRAVYLGKGPGPQKGGQGFEETDLRPGDVIVWSGVTLTYGGDAAEGHMASLEELPSEAPKPAPAPASATPNSPARTPEQERIWRRLMAGMMVELDMTDRKLVKAWQQRVVDGGFKVEDCANELYEAGRGRIDELRLLERSGRLLRDFLMTPLTRGVRGAGRKARMATKRGVAWVVAQFVVVAIYTVILLLIMAFLYQRGTSFDGLFERFFPRG